MPIMSYSEQEVLTSMCVWEHFLNDDQCLFHKEIAAAEGATSQRDWCVKIACNIEDAWGELDQTEKDTFIQRFSDNDCWDWEVVPSLCNQLAKHELLDAHVLSVKKLLKKLVH